jgi:hypothetical protein
MGEMFFVKRGTLNNTNNSPHLSRENTPMDWNQKPMVWNQILSHKKKNIFSMNKGQSSKGKPSFDDTCFICKECGHWENDCELKQTIKQM